MTIPSLLLLLSLLSGAPPGQPLFWTDHLLIAHALGGIDGSDRTNSREAFEANYARGYRVFETDLLITTDNQLVARHDWGKELFQEFKQDQYVPTPTSWNPVSLEEFKLMPIKERYESLAWSEMLQLMVEYPDIYFVLDTKYTDEWTVKKQFRLLVDEAEMIDPALLDRIVPQLYNQKMLGYTDSVHPFSSYIYTLYQSKDTNQQVVDFVRNNPRVKAVAMAPSRAKKTFNDSLKAVGAFTYVHTINDYSTYLKLQQAGVQGVYSDFLGYEQVLKDKKGRWLAAPPLPAEATS